jgi:hypothetical protein
LDGTDTNITQLDNVPTANSENPAKSGGIYSELLKKANTTAVYTKTETDNLLSSKANSSTVYTKTQVDSALNNKANVNNVYTKSEIDS